MHKLILWDIDGTLLYSGGVAGEAMRAAMELVYGRASVEARHSYAGKTDRQIILETFAERGHDDLMATIDHFTATYIEELSRRRDDFLARCRVLDGVAVALERLAAADVIQSVLTGNLQPIARLKLDLMGLSRFLDLDVGAYGSDHHHRPELVPVAAARAAQRYGRSFSGADIVVIGDTPNDIDCGRVAGARTIAVATGPFSVDVLLAHGADVVLPNLSNTDQVLQSIFGADSAV
ncbi:MAG TPA: HAD family hydrolase [Roseiflexaceae bacterium]|nr:HAD family hydrolase [Roseiflexaceae bacterium]